MTALSYERLRQDRQADIHPVVDRGMVVREFLVSVRHTHRGPGACASAARHRPDCTGRRRRNRCRAPSAASAPRRAFRPASADPRPASWPSARDDLAGVERHRQAHAIARRGIGIEARGLRQHHDDVDVTVLDFFAAQNASTHLPISPPFLASARSTGTNSWRYISSKPMSPECTAAALQKSGCSRACTIAP